MSKVPLLAGHGEERMVEHADIFAMWDLTRNVLHGNADGRRLQRQPSGLWTPLEAHLQTEPDVESALDGGGPQPVRAVVLRDRVDAPMLKMFSNSASAVVRSLPMVMVFANRTSTIL